MRGRLNLYRNYVLPYASDKIHFSLISAGPIKKFQAVGRQLGTNIVFNKAALKVVQQSVVIQNVVYQQVLHAAAKTCVAYVKFKARGGTVRLQGEFNLLQAEHSLCDSRKTYPFNGVLKIRRAAARLYAFILELSILLGKLRAYIPVNKTGL